MVIEQQDRGKGLDSFIFRGIGVRMDKEIAEEEKNKGRNNIGKNKNNLVDNRKYKRSIRVIYER